MRPNALRAILGDSGRIPVLYAPPCTRAAPVAFLSAFGRDSRASLRDGRLNRTPGEPMADSDSGMNRSPETPGSDDLTALRLASLATTASPHGCAGMRPDARTVTILWSNGLE